MKILIVEDDAVGKEQAADSSDAVFALEAF